MVPKLVLRGVLTGNLSPGSCHPISINVKLGSSPYPYPSWLMVWDLSHTHPPFSYRVSNGSTSQTTKKYNRIILLYNINIHTTPRQKHCLAMQNVKSKVARSRNSNLTNPNAYMSLNSTRVREIKTCMSQVWSPPPPPGISQVCTPHNFTRWILHTSNQVQIPLHHTNTRHT